MPDQDFSRIRIRELFFQRAELASVVGDVSLLAENYESLTETEFLERWSNILPVECEMPVFPRYLSFLVEFLDSLRSASTIRLNRLKEVILGSVQKLALYQLRVAWVQKKYFIRSLILKCLASALSLFPDSSENVLTKELFILSEKVSVAELISRKSSPLPDATFLEIVTDCLKDDNPWLFLRCLKLLPKYNELVLPTLFFKHWILLREIFSSCLQSDELRAEFIVSLNANVNYSAKCMLLKDSDALLDSWLARAAGWILDHRLQISTTATDRNFATNQKRTGKCECTSKATGLILLLKAFTINIRMEGTTKIMEEYSKTFDDLFASSCRQHGRQTTSYFLCSLFDEDDEKLCEMLLCCLHLSMIRNLTSVPRPEDLFDALLDLIVEDHFVLVSWITDNQNCFLGYFLQYLKFIDEKEIRVKQTHVFSKIIASLETLSNNGDIAFNVAPLVRRLRNVIGTKNNEI